jgi:hypothetical protein
MAGPSNLLMGMSCIEKTRTHYRGRHILATQQRSYHIHRHKRHCFPSNFWRNKITNSKESDKCDLCKALWVSQGRFTTDQALPIQTLGHIQHTCEALSELHTMAHHRCWRLIHGELSRLASSKWRFACINSEKCFRTVWKELAQDFPEVFDQCAEQTLWNAARDTELRRPLTQAEEMRRKERDST